MPGFLAQLGMQAAGQATGTGMGLLLQRGQDRRHLNMQRKLQRMEMEGSKEMTDYNFQKQLEMWEATNYKAQMAQLKQAGLNPGLIYGMGGAGGATTNVDTGSTSSGQAPKGGGEALAMGISMGQAAMQAAQIENLKAQTEKTKAETGAIPTSVQKMQAEIGNIQADTNSKVVNTALANINIELAALQREYQSATMENRKSLVNIQLSKLIEETKIIENDREISDATKAEKIIMIGNQVANIAADTLNKEKQTAVGSAQIEKINQEIKNLQQTWDINSIDQEMAKDGISPNTGRLAKILYNLFRMLGGIGR